MRNFVPVLMGLLLVAMAWDVHRANAPHRDDSLKLIYVGADDCAPCQTWRRKFKPGFLASNEGQRVHYREVIAEKLGHVFAETAWPADLKKFRGAAEQVQGVPLWLLVREEKVIANHGGLAKWHTEVLPRLRQEVRDDRTR